MSWMTPVSVPRGDDPPIAPRSADMRSLRRVAVLVVPEQFVDAAAALLPPVEREAEIGDRVPYGVVRGVVVQPDEHRPLVRPGLEAAPIELGQQLVGAL